MDFTVKEDYQDIYSKDTVDINPEVETPLTPIWITLTGLKWHYFNWDAVLRITSPIGTLLRIDKASNVRTGILKTSALGSSSIASASDNSKLNIIEHHKGNQLCQLTDEGEERSESFPHPQHQML
ncbi:hypothetical protein P3L10_003685 [Capsicum annuum]